MSTKRRIAVELATGDLQVHDFEIAGKDLFPNGGTIALDSKGGHRHNRDDRGEIE